MRIAYVALHLGAETMQGGVGGKLYSQVQMWQDMGHESCLFLSSPDPIDPAGIKVFTYHPGTNFPVFKTLTREISRSAALAGMICAIDAYQPDVIYLRYGLFAYPLQRLFLIAPVVIELNTNDVDEYRTRGYLYYLANRLTRGSLLGQASGFVALTEEISVSRSNEKYRQPCQVIANGVILDQYEPCAAPANDPPVIIFAGTPGFSWHGVDKLITLARLCPDLKIEIVGYCQDDLDQSIPGNMVLHGFIPKSQVKSFLARADVACGTLALHRKKMEDACPIKVREYLTCGLPTILGYRDTDLSDLKVDFLLQIPNDESNIVDHAERIREFAWRMRGKRVDQQVIRPRIDQALKEETRLAFFEKIIQVSRKQR